MSTKIYNGLLIDNPEFKDIFKLNDFCNELRKKITAKREFLVAKLQAGIIQDIILWDCVFKKYGQAFCYDTVWDFKEKKKTITPLLFSFYEIIDRSDKIYKTGSRDPKFDFGCFLTIYFSHNNKMLMLVNTEQKDFMEIVRSYNFIKDYPYFDNTDRPNGVSEEEWDLRADEWMSAMGNFPSNYGFSFHAAPVIGTESRPFIGCIDWDEISFHLSPHKDMCEVAADRILRSEFFKLELKKYEESTGDQPLTSEIISILDRRKVWEQTDEYKIKKNNIIKNISPDIPDVIKKNMALKEIVIDE